MKLDAPKEYWKLTKEERDRLLNKCGPDGPLNSIIPNHLMGVDISESCNIHGYMYSIAKTKKDLDAANSIFLSNIKREIGNKKQTLLYFIRVGIGYIYYSAVRLYSRLKSLH